MEATETQAVDEKVATRVLNDFVVIVVMKTRFFIPCFCFGKKKK